MEALIRDQFLQGVASSVIVGFLFALGRWLVRACMQILEIGRNFNISGHWVTSCDMANGEPPLMEIWRYWVRGSKVKLAFYAYHNDKENTVTKLVGHGVFRSKVLSGFYYERDPHSYDAGAVCFEVSNSGLEGTFMTFDVKKKNDPLHFHAYSQRRVKKFSLGAKIRMAFGHPPVRSYADARKIYEGAFGAQT